MRKRLPPSRTPLMLAMLSNCNYVVLVVGKGRPLIRVIGAQF